MTLAVHETDALPRPPPATGGWVASEAARLRQIAEAGPIGKRHSSRELYDLLAQCMALAEVCKSPDSYEEIRSIVVDRRRNRIAR